MRVFARTCEMRVSARSSSLYGPDKENSAFAGEMQVSAESSYLHGVDMIGMGFLYVLAWCKWVQKSVAINTRRWKMNKAIFLATLAFVSADVFGVDEIQGSNVASEQTQEKAITSEEAKELYAKLPLHYAVWKRDKDLLLQQIKKFGTEDINGKAENGRTPLIIAAINGDVDIAKVLVKNGADINLKSGSGSSPLMVAAYNNQLSMVKYLVKQKANVSEESNSYGFTALMSAANADCRSVVKYLIKNKEVVADINHQSKKGNTALILAALKGNEDIMKLLIEAGADVNITNKKGEDALAIVKKLSKRLTNILKKAGAEEVTTSELKSKNLRKRTVYDEETNSGTNAKSKNKHKNKRRNRKNK